MPVASPLTKFAAGDAQTFESSLASLGRSVMASKCPSLFRHEIGFQVLDSDEDNTRAVGVFGFRVGDRILYAPMFYRDGRIKGTGQLRDPKRKMTVPLTDNWVNKILSDRGDEPAEPVSRAGQRSQSQPSLWQIKYPPSKYAADAADWVALARADLARAIGRRPRWPDRSVDLVKAAASHPAVFSAFCSMVTRYPWFGEAVERYHGRAKVAAALAAVKNYRPAPSPARKLASVPAAAKKAGVVVVRVRSFDATAAPLHPGMSAFPAAALVDLRAGRNHYKDSRGPGGASEVVTWLGGHDEAGTILSNPGTCGVYRVLGADGAEHPCVVLTAMVGWGRPENQGRCLVVRLKDGASADTHSNAVWVTGEADPSEYADWVKTLPAVGDKLAEGKRLVAITPGPGMVVATVPFEVHDNETGEAYPCGCGGRSVFDAPFWARKPPPVQPSRNLRSFRLNQPETARHRVRVTDKPGTPFFSGNCLYIPNDAKLIAVGDDRLDLAAGSDPEHLRVRRAKEKKAAAAGALALVVGTGSGGFYVDDPRPEAGAKRAWHAHAPDCEESLVVGHNMKVADAREVVDRAAKAGKVEVAVKYAGPLDESAAWGGPAGPGGSGKGLAYNAPGAMPGGVANKPPFAPGGAAKGYAGAPAALPVAAPKPVSRANPLGTPTGNPYGGARPADTFVDKHQHIRDQLAPYENGPRHAEEIISDYGRSAVQAKSVADAGGGKDPGYLYPGETVDDLVPDFVGSPKPSGLPGGMEYVSAPKPVVPQPDPGWGAEPAPLTSIRHGAPAPGVLPGAGRPVVAPGLDKAGMLKLAGPLSNDWPNAPATEDPMANTPDGFADDVLPSETPVSQSLTIDDLAQQPDTAERYRAYPTTAGIQAPVDGIGNGGGAGGSPDQGQPQGGPTPKDLEVVSRAAETGRKELFDTAALAALVKHTNLTRLLEDVGPRLCKSMSDLADIIAHMSWNTTDWTEQFGESEVGPIEDQAQDLFEGLGDLYLTLLEKQVVDPRNFGILPQEFQGSGADTMS